MDKRFCTNCGKPLREGAAFCTSCGAAVNKPQPEIPQSQQPLYQPAPQPTAVVTAASVAEKKPAKPKRKKPMASLSICLALFVFVGSLILFLGLRQNTTEENGEELAMAAFQGVDLTQIKAAKIVADDDYEGSVADWIVERAMEESKDKDQFDNRDFERYLEASPMIKKLTQHTGSLASDIRDGADGDEITTKDMRKMLEDDRETIKEYLHFNITEKDINKVIAELERTNALDYTNPGTLRQKAPGVYYTIQYGLSNWVLLGLLALIAMCGLCLFFAKHKNLKAFLNSFGITVALSGGLSVAVAMLLMAFGGWMFENLGALSFVGSALSYMAGNFIFPAFVVAALGTAMLCTGIFLKKDAE